MKRLSGKGTLGVAPIMLWLTVLGFLATGGLAAQDGLYGPQDSDDALVRVIHAAPGAGRLPIDLGAASYGTIGYGTITPYRPVFPGMFVLRAEGREFSFSPRTGRYYSLVFGPAGFYLLEDTTHDDPARSQVAVYNLADTGAISLHAYSPESPDQSVPVVSGVEPETNAAAAVNPVGVSFRVRSEKAPVDDVGAVSLRRGASFSVIVMGGGDAIDVFLVEASVAYD